MTFPTDASDTVKNLYENATTQVKLPSGRTTGKIPDERGTIQGDTLSAFVFLLYMEPLLRWLHVGGHGYKHGCIPGQNATDTHLALMMPDCLSVSSMQACQKKPGYTFDDN
eukprot:201449-Pelagomonas_calceolata.AAC.1